MRRCVACIALLAALYGVVLYESVGLFATPAADANCAGCRLLGLMNVIVLPALMLAAVIGVRRLWLDSMPNARISRLLTAPLWLTFSLSLLTVPIGMGQANVDRHGADAVGGFAPTFLLAPWGFMVAYGFSLLVICAMFDFTFPVQAEATTQPTTVLE